MTTKVTERTNGKPESKFPGVGHFVDLPEPAERIDAADMGFHKHIASEQLRARSIQEQANAFIAELRKIDGAKSTWSEYLTTKYKLVGGDGVEEDGTIIRNTPKPPLEPAGEP